MSEAVNSLVQATVDHLAQFAPFDQMAREHLLWMAQRLSLGYFAQGEVILAPEQAAPLQFFVIKQGVVQGEQGSAQTAEGAPWLELREGKLVEVHQGKTRCPEQQGGATPASLARTP